MRWSERLVPATGGIFLEAQACAPRLAGAAPVSASVPPPAASGAAAKTFNFMVMQNDLVPHNRKVSVSASGMAQLEAAMAEKLEMQVRCDDNRGAFLPYLEFSRSSGH